MLCEINFNMHYFDFQVLQMQEGRGQDLDRNQEVDHVQDRDHPRVQEVQEVVVRQVNQAEEAVLGPEVQAVLVLIDRKESCFFFCFLQISTPVFLYIFWNHQTTSQIYSEEAKYSN